LKKECSIEDAEKSLKANLIEEVGDLAKLDIFRKVRTGVVEVIYAENKTPQMVLDITNSFLDSKNYAIISIITRKPFEFTRKKGKIGIITAGSSDIPVAEEAKVIAESMGSEVISSYDLGIAGIHRIFNPLSEMIKTGVHVIIVCAGMEGTLPGVVAALVDIPVIGVPVSSGYGLGEKGLGALTTMLQSCSPGLLVVNIDNGFGAGASAALIANRAEE